jgi:hypothetical protein
LGYPEKDRPKPVLNNFTKKVAKQKESFSILPTNMLTMTQARYGTVFVLLITCKQTEKA